jgi:hypothetical protein
MLLLRTEKLPDSDAWCYEIKFDGYRALAIKTVGKVHLRSRNDNDFTVRYPQIVKGCHRCPTNRNDVYTKPQIPPESSDQSVHGPRFRERIGLDLINRANLVSAR